VPLAFEAPEEVFENGLVNTGYFVELLTTDVAR
jgi:hypothetical protein